MFADIIESPTFAVCYYEKSLKAIRFTTLGGGGVVLFFSKKTFWAVQMSEKFNRATFYRQVHKII